MIPKPKVGRPKKYDFSFLIPNGEPYMFEKKSKKAIFKANTICVRASKGEMKFGYRTIDNKIFIYRFS